MLMLSSPRTVWQSCECFEHGDTQNWSVFEFSPQALSTTYVFGPTGVVQGDGLVNRSIANNCIGVSPLAALPRNEIE